MSFASAPEKKRRRCRECRKRLSSEEALFHVRVCLECEQLAVERIRMREQEKSELAAAHEPPKL
jgi:hypothetical protein